jgi:hypothetical protein
VIVVHVLIVLIGEKYQNLGRLNIKVVILGRKFKRKLVVVNVNELNVVKNIVNASAEAECVVNFVVVRTALIITIFSDLFFLVTTINHNRFLIYIGFIHSNKTILDH